MVVSRRIMGVALTGALASAGVIFAFSSATARSHAVGAAQVAARASSHIVAMPPLRLGARRLRARPGVVTVGTRVLGSALLTPRVFANARVGFALADDGSAQYPALSTDGGRSWRIDGPQVHVDGADGPEGVGYVGIAGPRTFYAYGSSVVDVTTDAGRTWWESFLGELVMAVVPGADGELVAFVQQSAADSHASPAVTWQYVSRDGGRHWSYSTALGAIAPVGVRRPLNPQRDATGLLGRVILPDGAVRSSSEPGGDSGALSRPALTQAGMRVVDLHQFWTVPESESAAWAFLRDHVPAGAKLLYTAGPSRSGYADSVDYAFAPGPGYLPSRQLMVSVITLTAGGSGLRVDAVVQRIIPRPRGERISATARVLTVTLGRAGHQPSVSRTVTNHGRVAQIAAMINRLQTVQPEAINCPAESGAPWVVAFTFRARADGSVLARATEPADAIEPTTPCDPMTLVIDGRRWTPLLGGAGVVDRVHRMLGVELTR